MVGWYDLGQLARTAVQVVISTIFGQHSDARLREALAPGQEIVRDYTKDEGGGERREIWIDYVADTGDGFNSTYAVAYHVARPALDVADPAGHVQRTERGRILILGGDQVYPVASRAEYQRRVVAPWEQALRFSEAPSPDVYAVPGNHDWYDSLVAFLRLFCSQRWFGGWKTQQTRSYFALKLPQRWWLLGTDVQLASDIDEPQLAFFRSVATQMKDGDAVIICNAEPHWVYAQVYGDFDAEVYNESNLAFLENKILRDRRVAVFVAGDLHHYRRHEGERDRTQKITCGGGGAFLHPTHAPEAGRLVERDERGAKVQDYALRAAFPPVAACRRLAWRNLLFPFLNPAFGIVPAILYLITSWTVLAPIQDLGLRDIGMALHRTFETVLLTPFAVFWILTIFGGFFMFTDTHSRWYRIVGGTLHGLAHLTALFSIGWLAAAVTVHGAGLPFKSIGQLLLAGLVIAVGGYVAGSMIMGIYLLISVNAFGRHANEAFSSLKIEDWKSFLRLHVRPDGTLEIFPIGLTRVPRRWRSAAGGGGSEIAPDDPAATAPVLIERIAPLVPR
jgi:hypothetical protein